MDSRRVRASSLPRIAVPLLVMLVGAAGFVVSTHAVNAARDAAAGGRASAAAQQVQEAVVRAGAFAAGIGSALARDRVPSRRRFVALVSSGPTSIGLRDAMWVRSVTSAGRHAYQALFVTSGLPFRPGSDLSKVPVLAAGLANPASIFGGAATPPQVVAGQPGFFVVQGTAFGRGPGANGFVVVFVPAGWLVLSLNADLSRTAVSLDGRRLAGSLGGAAAEAQRFQALTQQWRVDAALDPETPAQRAARWVALGGLPAAALLVYLIGSGITRRRRAEREVDDIFDLSPDLLGVISGDGYVRRVNPAFERTLGYSASELLERPLMEHVHPADREAATRALRGVREGDAQRSFESRFVRPDGTVCWLEWDMRFIPERDLMYAAARDVTENRELVDELAASRKRIVTTADETRRRLERNLHDGAQQRLVVLSLKLRAAQDLIPPGQDVLVGALSSVADGLDEAQDELREFARGVHPAILVKGGLGPALHALARRSTIPVQLNMSVNGGLHRDLEVTAYYVVSEALTNAAKHSGAEEVEITIEQVDDTLRVAITDAGRGGARATAGSGLVGLRDRVEAVGGTLSIDSPPGRGTRLVAELPLGTEASVDT